MMERPPQIKAHHLEKLGLIWVRESTRELGWNNVGSTDVQRGLREHARVWGWPASRIQVIEEVGVGVSGSTGPRPQFQQALDLMDREKVAIVFFNDASRLSRNSLDAEAFLVSAMAHGVLVEICGKLYAPGSADLAELFGLRIQNLLTLLRKIDERAASPAGGGDEPRDSAPAGEVDASGRHGIGPTTAPQLPVVSAPKHHTSGGTRSGQEPSDPAQDR